MVPILKSNPNYCCNQIARTTDTNAASLISLLGIVTSGVQQVGLSCNPMSTVGTGPNPCTAIPAYCTGQDISGLIVFNCCDTNDPSC